MNREDIIRMAREAWLSEKEAQLITEFDEAYISCTYLQDLEKFAALVASAAQAKEREACARLAEMPIGEYKVVVACGTEPAPNRIPQYANWQDIAKAIRARVRDKV